MSIIALVRRRLIGRRRRRVVGVIPATRVGVGVIGLRSSVISRGIVARGRVSDRPARSSPGLSAHSSAATRGDAAVEDRVSELACSVYRIDLREEQEEENGGGDDEA